MAYNIANLLAIKAQGYESNSSNFTAKVGFRHTVLASCVVTDPTEDLVGSWYEVYIKAGTATINGTGYSQAGLVIRRFWTGLIWENHIDYGAAINNSGAATIANTVTNLTAFAGKTAPNGAIVGTTDTQTLTNKTLTSPQIDHKLIRLQFWV
jgi:hypothetical protein